MIKTTHLLKNKTILILLAILILCVIITYIVLQTMYSEKTPVKAIYVIKCIL